MACSYKQEVEEEGGLGDRAFPEKISAGERRGWNSPQPHLPIPTEHVFLSLLCFVKQIVRGKAVVILLPPWMQSGVFLSFSHGKLKLTVSQTKISSRNPNNTGDRSKIDLAGPRGELKA